MKHIIVWRNAADTVKFNTIIGSKNNDKPNSNVSNYVTFEVKKKQGQYEQELAI